MKEKISERVSIFSAPIELEKVVRQLLSTDGDGYEVAIICSVWFQEKVFGEDKAYIPVNCLGFPPKRVREAIKSLEKRGLLHIVLSRNDYVIVSPVSTQAKITQGKSELRDAKKIVDAFSSAYEKCYGAKYAKKVHDLSTAKRLLAEYGMDADEIISVMDFAMLNKKGKLPNKGEIYSIGIFEQPWAFNYFMKEMLNNEDEEKPLDIKEYERAKQILEKNGYDEKTIKEMIGTPEEWNGYEWRKEVYRRMNAGEKYEEIRREIGYPWDWRGK